jgi:hypothetical protein
MHRQSTLTFNIHIMVDIDVDSDSEDINGSLWSIGYGLGRWHTYNIQQHGDYPSAGLERRVTARQIL